MHERLRPTLIILALLILVAGERRPGGLGGVERVCARLGARSVGPMYRPLHWEPIDGARRWYVGLWR